MHSSPAPQGADVPAKILIAEDHPDSREALCILLEALGYRVAVAADGRAAIALALAELPDLILMDIMMPEIDGFEAMRRLRRHEAMQGVPIIALTAMEGSQELALEAGASDHLAKPIDARQLIGALNDWLAPRVA